MAATGRIGMYVFVMIAVGRVIAKPRISPDSHPGKDTLDTPITNPITRQLKNAPIIARFLSFSGGKGIGIIRATSIMPNTTPQIEPSKSRDIIYSPIGAFTSRASTSRSHRLQMEFVRFAAIAGAHRKVL
jgi:hypothetical protein